MAVAPNYWTLLAGRIVAGLAVGAAFVVAPCFISEVAPPDQRGQLNTTFDIAINAGILLGYIVCYVVQITLPDKGYSWRIILGMGALLPATVLWLLAGLPEPPRWLVLAKQQPAAKAVLQRLGSSNKL
jgi:MFS family permease